MTATLVFLKNVNLSYELLVRMNSTWLSKYLTSLDLLLVDTAEEETYVVTSLSLIEELAEHLDTCNDSLLRLFTETYDLNLITYVDDTGLDTSSCYSTTTCDREDVLDWHKEWLLIVTWRKRNVLVNSCHKFHNLSLPLWVTVECTECRTTDYRSVVTVEVVE